MMKTCGLPVTLKDLGITEKEIDVIVSEGFAPERMGNNPYVFTADSLQKMLLSILR
jgi:alcohol dehydrogenase class IV